MHIEAILACLERITHYDKQAFTPLFFDGERLGCVNREWRERLLACESALFSLSERGLHCNVDGDYGRRSALLGAAARRWRDIGWLSGWRDENFTAFALDGTPLFELERAAFRPLGLTSEAVHLNALTRLADGEVRMWIGRRSPHKSVEPNRLDNAMGGGVAAGESLAVALQREGWEEAGIPAVQLAALTPCRMILAERPVARGLHREWLYAHDLWLAEGEAPQNQDGEVAEHLCLPLAEVEALIAQERFMNDAALVAIDSLLRLGYWGEHGRLVADAMAHVAHPLPPGGRAQRDVCSPAL